MPPGHMLMMSNAVAIGVPLFASNDLLAGRRTCIMPEGPQAYQMPPTRQTRAPIAVVLLFHKRPIRYDGTDSKRENQGVHDA